MPNPKNDALSAASGVVGEERKRIAAFSGQIIDCSDESLAFAVFSRWIAFFPVFDVRCPSLEWCLAKFAGDRVVEVGVSKKCFWCIGTDLQKIPARFGESQGPGQSCFSAAGVSKRRSSILTTKLTDSHARLILIPVSCRPSKRLT